MIERLKAEVEQVAERRMVTPRDFEWLGDRIVQVVGERLSATTLKRLWGYVNGGTPRRFTLDILARFAGYADYAAFCSGCADDSNILLDTHSVVAERLCVGEELVLRWVPDRKVTIRHMGGARFDVLSAENTKLAVGDSFVCHLFVDHQPLYITQLLHKGRHTGYVAGKRNGITVEQVVPKD